MIVKRFILTAIALGPALALASCGGGAESGFSGYVADHWPHWAGGLPEDAPPRPGAPGYSEFISHGGADQTATESPAVTFQKTPPGPAKAGAQTVPAAKAVAVERPIPAAEETAPVNPSPEDASVVKGGLY
jgi:hypothetical protein